MMTTRMTMPASTQVDRSSGLHELRCFKITLANNHLPPIRNINRFSQSSQLPRWWISRRQRSLPLSKMKKTLSAIHSGALHPRGWLSGSLTVGSLVLTLSWLKMESSVNRPCTVRQLSSEFRKPPLNSKISRWSFMSRYWALIRVRSVVCRTMGGLCKISPPWY